MKKQLQILTLALVGMFFLNSANAQVKIGNNPTSILPGSILELESDSLALVLPRMTTAKMDLIATPTDGMMIYNTTDSCVHQYSRGEWTSLCSDAYCGTVLVDSADANHAAAAFTPNDPANVCALYVSEADGSTWVYDATTSAYITKATKVEPWFNIATNLPSQSLTDDIYHRGNVIVGEGVVTGDLNFLVGLDDTVSGNYNIVQGESNSITGLKNFVMGDKNTVNTELSGLAITGTDTALAGYNTIFGDEHTISDNVNRNTVIGSGHILSSNSPATNVVQKNLVNGSNITIHAYSGSINDNVVFGQGHTLTARDVDRSLIGGLNNYAATLVSQSIVVGLSDTVQRARQSIVSGASNFVFSIDNTMVSGLDNTTQGTANSIASGNSNTTLSSNNSITSGISNSLTGENSIVSGSENKVRTTNSLVVGKSNIDSSTIAAGGSNILGGQFNVSRGDAFENIISGFQNEVDGGTGNAMRNIVSGALNSIDVVTLSSNDNLLVGQGNELSVGGIDRNLIGGLGNTLSNIVVSSSVVGHLNVVNGTVENSSVAGKENVMFGSKNSSVWGIYDTITSNHSAAWGTSNKVTADNSTAFGSNNKATGLNSIAIGNGAVAAANTMVVKYGTGSVTFDGSATWAFSSDRRLKDNITAMTYGLDEVMKMKPSLYNYKGTKETVSMGFIAQEIKEIVPEVVGVDAEGYYNLRYSELIPVLTKAIQELKAELDAANAELTVKSEELKSADARLELIEAALQANGIDIQTAAK